MDKLLIRILFCILILPSSLTLRGQEPGRSLETGQVEVIRDFDARLEETQKVPLAPIIPEYAQPAGQFDYLLPVRILAVDYPAPKIRPIAMGRDKEPKVYNGYAKAGFGTLAQPYGELGYGFRDEDKLALNVHMLHHAANNSGNRENQRFSETRGNLDFTLYSKDGMAVRGRGGYEADVNYLYGYNQADTSFLKEEVRRAFRCLNSGLVFLILPRRLQALITVPMQIFTGSQNRLAPLRKVDFSSTSRGGNCWMAPIPSGFGL